jgi:hypothetical protein
VAVDGKVFGFLIFARMQGRGDVYLLADFVVDSTRYSRLAKLLLLVIQSKEIRRMMEEHLLDELPTCRTMVFTDKPVLETALQNLPGRPPQRKPSPCQMLRPRSSPPMLR